MEQHLSCEYAFDTETCASNKTCYTTRSKEGSLKSSCHLNMTRHKVLHVVLDWMPNFRKDFHRFVCLVGCLTSQLVRQLRLNGTRFRPYRSHMTEVITYLLTPWCRFLPEQLTGFQLVKKFPAFHGTPRFITALTSVRHLSLSWASPIQST